MKLFKVRKITDQRTRGLGNVPLKHQMTTFVFRFSKSELYVLDYKKCIYPSNKHCTVDYPVESPPYHEISFNFENTNQYNQKLLS